MTFVTGMLLIDAPASALNNSGEPIPGARTDNTSSVKFIRVGGNYFPYVSAQAVRYWLRNTLETADEIEWRSSPVHREEKVAYVDGNPLLYWDDDLLGYMRAPSKRSRKEEDESALTPLEDEQGKPTTVTRASPFRVSTFVSISPANITVDYGTMTRQDGDPVPYEHQFYRAALQGLVSLDLNMAGKFFYRRRTGFQNLDAVRKKLAEEQGLVHLEEEKAYRLDRTERLRRIQSLLVGLSRLQGGAKQAIHYTDVTPAVTVLAVTTGGNHPFSYLFRERSGSPQFQEQAFADTLEDARDQLLSPVFVGWKPGYLPDEQAKAAQVNVAGIQVEMSTPRVAFERIIDWLEQHQEVWDA